MRGSDMVNLDRSCAATTEMDLGDKSGLSEEWDNLELGRD
jgi:hypothetical protein